jgi:hypothetical protein
MTKKEYKDLVGKLGKKIILLDWLDVLPCYDKSGEAVTLKEAIPIIAYPVKDRVKIDKKLTKFKRKRVWSTVNYLAGYHYPEGYDNSAIGFMSRPKLEDVT